MKKQTLLVAIFSIGNIILAQQLNNDKIQETANNIATELQIPVNQRETFVNEYTNKSLAIQSIITQNISPQAKVDQLKTVLSQSAANLKQVTPATQLNRYNNYFNKQVQLTANLNTVKTPSSLKDENVNLVSDNLLASNSSVSYTKNSDYQKLPTEHQAVMDNIGTQLQLNNNQFGKMSTDYLNFVTTTENIIKSSGNNLIKAKLEFDNLATNTFNSTKTYLNTEQSNAFQKLVKDGTLGKDTNPRVAIANNTGNNNASNTPNITANNNKNLSDIKSAQTLTQLKNALSLTPAQYTNALKIANNYDAEIAKVCALYPNNINQQKTALDKKTPAYVSQFKAALTPVQVNTYFGVIIAQVNILTGNNLTPDQQKLIATMKNEYNMNDVQIIQAMFTLTEAKIKADGNKLANKNNPQAFNQETQKILNDADVRLKDILTTDQYNKVKADIEKALK